MIETDRLRIREFTRLDTAFVIALLNDPEWIKNIGDKQVRTKDDALAYLINGPMASYRSNGYGLSVVELKHDHVAIGTCGLIRRPGLDDVDIGFAILAKYRGSGYAREAATAVLESAAEVHGLSRVVAIVLRENQPSVRLLERLGMRYEKDVVLPGASEVLAYFSITLS